MSEFDDNCAEIGRPALLAALGDAGITYTPADGSAAVSLTSSVALVGRRADREEAEEGGLRIFDRAELIGSEADLSEPQHGGTFSIAGETWAIEGVSPAVGGMWTARIVRTGVHEKTNRGYRL